jgi:alanine racemase
MINPLTWLSRRRFPYEPLIKVEVSRSRLIHNLNEFRRLAPGGRIAPVLKSNAYGHGLLEVATILEAQRCKEKNAENCIPFFVVDSYFEAIALRAKGIRTPLLIIGYNRPETILNSHLSNVCFTVTSIETLKAISATKKRIAIHLKIDTGMHRQGILPSEVMEAIKILRMEPKIYLNGICSHLSDADNLDPTFTEKQITVWNKVSSEIVATFPSIEYIHLSATHGHSYSILINANATRLGIGLYGITEHFNNDLNLKPALQMKTIITGIKELKQGETIGYGNSFKAEKNMAVATIPVGYFEGIDRRLSNTGFVEVGSDKVKCPIVGKVSMNITSIDISNIKDAKIGTKVVVVSNDPKSMCSIQSMAELAKTIEYEIAVHIPEHLKRVVVE